MDTQKNKSLASVAGFGAALASVYTAPELTATVVSLNFNPGSVAWTSSSTVRSVSVTSSGGNAVMGFNQWNDSVGKTFVFDESNMASWRTAPAGEILNTSTFAGGASSLSNSTSATGTVYMGFRTLGGQVGWFATNLGGAQGAMVFTEGQVGTTGDSVKVGSATAVPEPGSVGLALLAIGASGLRRRRAANN